MFGSIACQSHIEVDARPQLLQDNPAEWTLEDVLAWSNKVWVAEKTPTKTLRRKCLGSLVTHSITGEKLLTLDEEKIRELGVPQGPAAVLAAALTALKSKTSTKTD
jgi:hypothetical protein